MSGSFAITGIPPPKDAAVKTKTIPYAVNMPLRYEVSDPRWSNDSLGQKQWTLFILGLDSFQKMKVDEKLSYFQVAGIHGYPEQTWDGAPPPKPDPNAAEPAPGAPPYGGYCHHNTVAFPTWHRPYLLLFEQCIWLNMNKVIESWVKANWIDDKEAQVWHDAANGWRLPYWDYAQTHVPALPQCFTEQDIQIWPPASVKVANPYPSPLWGFKNPETDSKGNISNFGAMPKGKEQYNIKADTASAPFMPWNLCKGVSRYGITMGADGNYAGLEGVNNVAITQKALANFEHEWYVNPKSTGTLQDAAKRLLSPGTFKSWGTFASTKWNYEQATTEYLSLEFIHNNVHGIVGGSNYAISDKNSPFQVGVGHMSDVPVAAFDPIFWLHHSNVDRWTAMFQILNWNLWFDREPSDNKDDYVPDVLPSDPLTPFRMIENAEPDQGFWTSNLCRDWTKLHYQYNDLVPSANVINADGTLNESKYITEIEQHIHQIYTGTGKLIQGIFEDPAIPNNDFLGADDGTWNDYVVNVVYDRYALDGATYSILFYLGGKKDDPESTFANPKNYVGQIYNFAGMPPRTSSSSPGTGCANCGVQSDGSVLSSAQLALTSQIVKQALDDSFTNIQTTTRAEVAKYLQEHLHWKFVQMGGTEVPADRLPKTQISVWCGIGAPRDGKAANYSSYEPLPEVTQNKPAGVAVQA